MLHSSVTAGAQFAANWMKNKSLNKKEHRYLCGNRAFKKSIWEVYIMTFCQKKCNVIILF